MSPSILRIRARPNIFTLRAHGRYRTNVWDYAGVNAFGTDRDAELALHPTVKPVALVEDAILDCSRRGGIVLDAFCGSGTTLIATERAISSSRASEPAARGGASRRRISKASLLSVSGTGSLMRPRSALSSMETLKRHRLMPA